MFTCSKHKPKETGTKTEEATLQFIRGKDGKRWFAPSEHGDYIPMLEEDTIESLYKTLVVNGLLTPDPLTKALEALNEKGKWTNTAYVLTKEDAYEILRTLYEDMK